MPTVLTVTFSPCIDKNIEVPELISERKLISSVPVLSPGGGGINVARVLRRFEKEVIAIYPCGGYTGKYFNDMMNEERVSSFVINTAGMMRENLIISETKTRKQFRLGTPATPLLPYEYEQVIKEAERIVSFRFLVVSGSLPPGVEIDVMSRLSLLARKRNAKFIVDTKGEPLRHALESGVFLIKPNLGELASLAGLSCINEDEVDKVGLQLLHNSNCEAMVVSMGMNGALLVSKNATYKIQAPPVMPVSTVGAGDSMVAGIITGLLDDFTLLKAVKFGVACGTAATMQAGSQLCEPEDARRLFDSFFCGNLRET